MAPQTQDERYPPGSGKGGSSPPDGSAEGDQSDEQAPVAAASDWPSAELISELMASVDRAEGRTAQGFAAVHQRLAAIEQMLGMTPGEATTNSAEETVEPSNTEASQEDGGDAVAAVETIPNVPADTGAPDPTTLKAPLEPQLPPMAQPVQAAPQPMPAPVQPVQDVRPASSPRSVAAPNSGELEAIVFGQDFAYHENLAPLRRSLLASAQQGQEDAVGLVGQVLIVRSATMDRLPTLLKDVGEAWYRWQGEDSSADALRDALITWLHTRLEAVGLGNRIDLVRVGDRYDSKRHNAKARGIEVTGVQGWVVLRDNGNVYTKANVTVA